MVRFGVQNNEQNAKRKRPSPNKTGGKQNDREGKDVNKGSTSDNRTSNVIITDMDVLDCPICAEPLKAPIFQCENGHIACGDCSQKVENKCPSCALPIGHIRCIAMEKILEQCSISCDNTKYGCKEVLRYYNKLVHEMSCNYAPCSCPHLGCDFYGASEQLFKHLSGKHKHDNSVMHFAFEENFSIDLSCFLMFHFLYEQQDGYIFLVKKSSTIIGHKYTVCPACVRSQKVNFSYTLTASNRNTTLQIISAVERGDNGDDYNNQNSLLIPTDFFGRDAAKVDLVIFLL